MTTKARISRARTTRATTLTAATERRSALLILTLTVGLAFSTTAVASDATLEATLHKWSRTIGVDAHSTSVAARQRHPRRMTTNALHFRSDALRAHTAVAAQRASSAAGRRGKDLALRAFANYAMAGKRWAASGRARLTHRRPRATAFARSAARFARRGNRLLVSAGRLLS
jgi:hypothetical protein